MNVLMHECIKMHIMHQFCSAILYMHELCITFALSPKKDTKYLINQKKIALNWKHHENKKNYDSKNVEQNEKLSPLKWRNSLSYIMPLYRCMPNNVDSINFPHSSSPFFLTLSYAHPHEIISYLQHIVYLIKIYLLL